MATIGTFTRSTDNGTTYTGAVSVGQMSSRGSRFGAAWGNRTGMRVSLNASR